MPRQCGVDNSNQALLLSHLSETELIYNPRLIEAKGSFAGKRGATIVFEAEVQIEDQSVTLQIGFDDWFPHSLPIISVVPWNALGFIPHVETNGYVCYAQKEGLLLNRRDTEGILDEALMRAVSVLANGYRGKNRGDFVDEFEAYWINLDGAQGILSVVAPTDGLREIIAGKKGNASNEESEYVYVTDDAACIRSYYNVSDLKQHTHRNALYISLKPDTIIIPPLPNSALVIDYFKEIVKKHLTKGELKIIRKLARKPK
ncbi:MAG TPA: E2/UBC family protein, partial [Bellilinea sp.]|nr:E2/UBC family protein [Bellilinea sp.]